MLKHFLFHPKGMDVQNNSIGRPSDFSFPGLPSSNINRRVMDNCLTYPGYSDPSLRHVSREEDPGENVRTNLGYHVKSAECLPFVLL